MRLILGSASPRRAELLAQLGLVADDVRPADIDETPHRNETPLAYVRRVAREKALAVPCGPDEVLLCGDTTVALGRRILGKPGSRDEAQAFLSLLSGRRHKVITGIAVRRGERLWTRDVTSVVRFKRLSAAEIGWYLDSGEWQGKAGGYAIQGRAAAFAPWISGSFTGIVGLPLAETAALLQAAGLDVTGGGA